MNNFENCPHKAAVRCEIIEQIVEFCRNRTNVVIATLPGVEWFFEQALIDALGDKLGKLICFEKNPNTFPFTKANKPNDPRIELIEGAFHLSQPVDISWLDLCENYTETAYDRVSHARDNSKLSYFTVSITPRSFSKGFHSAVQDYFIPENHEAKGKAFIEEAITFDSANESEPPLLEVFTYSYQHEGNSRGNMMLTWGLAAPNSDLGRFKKINNYSNRFSQRIYENNKWRIAGLKAVATRRANENQFN